MTCGAPSCPGVPEDCPSCVRRQRYGVMVEAIVWKARSRCLDALDALAGIMEERTRQAHRHPSPWQDIATAPKDATPVLLWWPFWCKSRPIVGWFGYKGIQQWVAAEALEGDRDPPLCWAHLPDPPTPTGSSS